MYQWNNKINVKINKTKTIYGMLSSFEQLN